MALTVLVLSAFSVFFLLYERDLSFRWQAMLAERVVYVTHPTSAPAVQLPLATPLTSAPVELPEVPFTLARSRRFQQVGPVRIGFWRTDAKQRYCDVSVMVNGRRFNGRHIGVNQPFSIPGMPIKLIVSRIARNDISGYLQGEVRSR